MNVGPVPGGPATYRPAGFREYSTVAPDINGGSLYAEPFGYLSDAYRVAISHEKSVAKVLTVGQGCSDNQYMTQTLDMNTAEGLIEYFKTLPTENLRAIAARPVYDAESTRMAVTADAILALRGE